MKIAIMQPYIFPYLGYFQLIHSVDKFILYDDVNFIKQGWVNRNRLMVNAKELMFSVPVMSISSFKTISETQLSHIYPSWTRKFLRTIELEFGKAPYFKDVFPLIEEVFVSNAPQTIGEVAKDSILKTCNYLGYGGQFVTSSAIYSNDALKGVERIIDICKRENASTYINLPGGRDLYAGPDFLFHNIDLKFIQPQVIPYKQAGSNEFYPWLSVIDVLMFNSVRDIRSNLLPAYNFDQ